jgi:hypothetical protein
MQMQFLLAVYILLSCLKDYCIATRIFILVGFPSMLHIGCNLTGAILERVEAVPIPSGSSTAMGLG